MKPGLTHTACVQPEKRAVFLRGTEPPHLLCANCFQQSKKSLLQSKGVVYEIETLNCPACRAEIYVKRPGQGLPKLC